MTTRASSEATKPAQSAAPKAAGEAGEYPFIRGQLVSLYDYLLGC